MRPTTWPSRTSAAASPTWRPTTCRPTGIIIVGNGNIKSGHGRLPRRHDGRGRGPCADSGAADHHGCGYTEQTLQTSSAQAVSADGTDHRRLRRRPRRANRAFVTTFLDRRDHRPEPSWRAPSCPTIDGGKWAEAYAMTPDGALHRRPQRQPQGPPGLHLVPGRMIPTLPKLGGQGPGRALQEEVGQRGHRHRPPPRIGGWRADGRGLQPDHPLPLGGLRLDRQPGARADETRNSSATCTTWSTSSSRPAPGKLPEWAPAGF